MKSPAHFANEVRSFTMLSTIVENEQFALGHAAGISPAPQR